MAWITPAQGVTGELIDAARFNELVDNFRLIGEAWPSATPLVQFQGGGSTAGVAGSGSSVVAAGLVMGATVMLRVRLGIATGGSPAFAEGDKYWGFSVANLPGGFNSFAADQALACTYYDISTGEPHPLSALAIGGGSSIVTTLLGGAFPVVPATGDHLTVSGVVQQNLA